MDKDERDLMSLLGPVEIGIISVRAFSLSSTTAIFGPSFSVRVG